MSHRLLLGLALVAVVLASGHKLSNQLVWDDNYLIRDAEVIHHLGDWPKVFSGNSTYKDNFAAGTAFLVLRRGDAKGLQLSKPGEHQMEEIGRAHV